MKNYCLLIGCFFCCVVTLAQKKDWKKRVEDPEYLHRAIKQVTDVIVHDIYSPPVASRIYAYVTVAGYEAARPSNNNYLSFAGQLHGLGTLPMPTPGKEYSYTLAAVHAVLLTGKALIISEDKIAAFQELLLAEIRASGIPTDVYTNSLEFGKLTADHIMAWSQQDNYKQTRSLTKYAVANDSGSWKPTPPSYMKAIEPHWSKLRSFLIDSAAQFKPAPATSFSVDTGSQFYREAKAVHDIGKALSPEQVEIANFWDCNPFKMNINGHVMYATKKISPGGHWINIAALACRKSHADFMKSTETYACLSLTLADAFISCWDEKYRSKVIRPETYINRYMDQRWLPLLQTPPFPEYTSGHSVLSAAAAVVLTKLFGDHFVYEDSTEVEFKIPVRNFTSFNQAAEEAAISRFYGGIHYMPAINNGLDEGRKLGLFIAQKLRLRKDDTALNNAANGYKP